MLRFLEIRSSPRDQIANHVRRGKGDEVYLIQEGMY